MSDTILDGDFTIYYSAENGQQRIQWTGSATGTRTLNAFYSALLKLFDDPAQMDDLVPMTAVTPAQYRLDNQWFIDDTTVERLTGGSLFTSGWKSGTTEYILVIGYAQTTEFNAADIGRTIVGTTTADTGTILDFNTTRKLIWIRPDDPAAAGDEFDDPDESYTVQNDPFDKVWQVDDSGGPSYVDETTDANSAAANDWAFFPAGAGVNDAAAVGFAQKFSKLVVNVGTAGTGTYTVTWEYWNGTAWTALAAVTDGTNAFKTAGTNNVTYTVPTDWTARTLSTSALLYWIRAKRDAGTVTLDPLGTQGFIGGVGAGAFARHGRHGEASKAGESAWAGITSIGQRETETSAYIFQEDPDEPSGSFKESAVKATKGTVPWWPHDAHLNILIKTKEADSVFGPSPVDTTKGSALFLMRQYSKLYSHFQTAALATVGGETVVPFAVGDDLNNTTGYRRFTGSGGAGTFLAEEVIGDNAVRASATELAVLTAVGGTVAAPILTYYLIDDLDDFEGAESITGYTSTATCTSGAPADFGPATAPDSTVTIAFGAVNLDINNGNGSRPYSVNIDPTASNVAIAKIYEVTKYRMRRGSATVLQGQDGQEYIGSELQVEYNAQSGTWREGDRVFDQGTDAVGIIVADHDDGATGDFIVKAARGTFTNANTASDSPDPSQQFNTPAGNGRVWIFDTSGGTYTDESVDADSAAAADVTMVGDNGDIVYFGVPKIFAKLAITISTSGVLGGATGTWEYWNGTAWTSLEGLASFLDGTTDFTIAPGTGNVTWYPPLAWTARSVNGSPVLYYVRWRVSVANMTTAPVLSQVLVEDFVTATINGAPRAIATVAAAPFGTFAGGKFFGAPGVALVITNLASTEQQAYQLIDDNGTTQTPPNTVSMTVTNLISGDSVAVFRRTGAVVTKTQFSLAAANNKGNTAVVVTITVPSDNPTTDNSKIRIISASGQEHRYRYDSYATATLTLSPASTGTATGGSTTTIINAGATFQTDEVEVGDLVRNTTDDLYSTVVSVDSQTQLTVTSNGTTWNAKTYSLNTLVESYVSGLSAYVPLIELVADAASESASLVQSSNIDVKIVVRRSSAATEILPFTQDTTLVSTGLSVSAIRSEDTIIT